MDTDVSQIGQDKLSPNRELCLEPKWLRIVVVVVVVIVVVIKEF